MLEKAQFYVRYAQQIINYAQKVISVINTAVRAWPKWLPLAKEETEHTTIESDKV